MGKKGETNIWGMLVFIRRVLCRYHCVESSQHGRRCYYFRFAITDKVTEMWIYDVICPGLHRY